MTRLESEFARSRALTNGRFALPIPIVIEHFDDPRAVPVRVRKVNRLSRVRQLARMNGRNER